MRDLLNRPLPAGLEGLRELALDIRWSWSHGSDRLWELLDRDTFERTNNPHLILQNVSAHRLEAAARDPVLKDELKHWLQQRQEYLDKPGWYGRTYPVDALRAIAYFGMEFGLTDALPIYSGGLGILAGAINSHRYRADAPAQRPAENYCTRIVPHHPQARIPLEERHIRWYR
jgi:starch phosphorylase